MGSGSLGAGSPSAGSPGHAAWGASPRSWVAGPRRCWWLARPSAIAVPAAAEGSAAAEEAAAEDEPPELRRKRTEAVLFLHRGSVNLRKLAGLAGLADATEARTRIRELNQIYDQSGSALRIEELAGGYQLFTRASIAPWLRRLRHLPQPIQLGAAAMETLAIIAYRQPVPRAEIEAIRGVNCGELIRQLMQRDLVRISGRSEELGRPYLYGTTPQFLQLFGLKAVGSIPALPGASILENSDDTLAFSEDRLQAAQSPTPIDDPITALNLTSTSLHPPSLTPPKESDVSIAPGPFVINDVADFMETDVAVLAFPPHADVVAVDEDDDLFEADDEEDEDWDDEDEDEDLDDVEEEDDEWEEVGDEEEEEDAAEDEEEEADVVDAEEELEEDEIDDEEEDWDDEDDADWDDEDDDDEDADEEEDEWD